MLRRSQVCIEAVISLGEECTRKLEDYLHHTEAGRLSTRSDQREQLWLQHPRKQVYE